MTVSYLFGKLLDELVAVRDAADGLHLVHRRVRPRKPDVFGDRAVEHEVVLQHDAELRAVVAQPHACEIAAVHEHASSDADG